MSKPEEQQPLLGGSSAQDSPPAYEVAEVGKTYDATKPQPQLGAQPQTAIPTMAGPSYVPQPATVYNYINPITGEHVVSLLPPHHPEMVCLQQGEHVPHTNYGILGIMAAILWFPLGIGLCLLDKRVKCERCGATLQDGVCNA